MRIAKALSAGNGKFTGSSQVNDFIFRESFTI